MSRAAVSRAAVGSRGRAALRSLAGVMWCAWLGQGLAPPEVAAQGSDLSLTLQCPGIDRAELLRMLRIERGTTPGPRLEIRCHGELAHLRTLSGPERSRTLSLSSIHPEVRTRTLALAAAVLASGRPPSTRSSESPSPEGDPNARTGQPIDEGPARERPGGERDLAGGRGSGESTGRRERTRPRSKAKPVAQATPARARRLRSHAAASQAEPHRPRHPAFGMGLGPASSIFASDRRRPLWGAWLGLELQPAPHFALLASVGFAQGSVARWHGNVSRRLVGCGLVAMAHTRTGNARLGAGLGAKMGWGRLLGTGADAQASPNRLEGAWTSPALVLLGKWQLTPEWGLSFLSWFGITTQGLTGWVVDGPDVRLDGPWVQLATGLDYRWSL